MANWPATRPTFTTWRVAAEGEDQRHLQEQLEVVADVVGLVLLEALGAIAALQQEALARAPRRRACSLRSCTSLMKTSGGKLRRLRSTSSSAAWSGYSGTWTIGLPLQLSGVHGAGMGHQLLACEIRLRPLAAGRR